MGQGYALHDIKQTDLRLTQNGNAGNILGFISQPAETPAKPPPMHTKVYRSQVMNVEFIYNGYIRWFGFPGPRAVTWTPSSEKHL